jgi:hypothetical protein
MGTLMLTPVSVNRRSDHDPCRHPSPRECIGIFDKETGSSSRIAQALGFVACLRKHGLPDMPDPTESGEGIELRGPSGAGPEFPGVC